MYDVPKALAPLFINHHDHVRHGGGIDGFITAVVLFPDDELGLVAFNNGESGISSLLTQSSGLTESR